MKRLLITAAFVLFGITIAPTATADTIQIDCTPGIVDLTSDQRLSSQFVQDAALRFEAATNTHFFVRGFDVLPESYDHEDYLEGMKDCGIDGWTREANNGYFPQDTTFIMFQRDTDGQYYGSVSYAGRNELSIKSAADAFFDALTAGDTEQEAILAYISAAQPLINSVSI